MKSIFASLILAITMTGCSQAVPSADLDPDFTFRLLNPNLTLAKAMPMLAACGASMPGNEHLCPLKDTKVAGVAAQTTGVLFDEGGFKELRVAWKPQDHAVVVADLTRAYGTPCSQATTDERDQYETRTNVTTQWCFAGGAMTLVKYADNFSAMRLTYVSDRVAPVQVAAIAKPHQAL